MISQQSKILVLLQFALIALIVVNTLVFPASIPTFTLFLISAIIGAWAIFTIRIRNVQVFPEPKSGSSFVATGPYAYIRHPMYTSVIGMTLALVIEHPTASAIIEWAALVLLLIIKLRFEESLLLQKYTEYTEYMKRSKRLLPFVF